MRLLFICLFCFAMSMKVNTSFGANAPYSWVDRLCSVHEAGLNSASIVLQFLFPLVCWVYNLSFSDHLFISLWRDFFHPASAFLKNCCRPLGQHDFSTTSAEQSIKKANEDWFASPRAAMDYNNFVLTNLFSCWRLLHKLFEIC